MSTFARVALLALLGVTGCLAAPRPPAIPAGENPARWAAEIRAFAEQDRAQPFEKGGVVFVGSSSIRFWSTLAADMSPIPVLNRGFGGSKLFDALYYAHELVGVHEPSLVVLFSGTNDLADADAKSALAVRDLFRAFVARLRADDPRLAIVYVAITPTLARAEHAAEVREANRLIQSECEADPRLEFVDPTPDLLDAQGQPDPQFFREDRLHLNERGYAVWTRHLRPVVERLYARERAARQPCGQRLAKRQPVAAAPPPRAPPAPPHPKKEQQALQ